MKALLVLALSLASTATWALPKAPFNALAQAQVKGKLSINPNYNFEGIVKLSNCSGSLVIFNGMPMTAKAIVMTNGHCIQKPGGFLRPGEVWVNRNVVRDMKVFDKEMKLHPIKSTKILYATMTDTDFAFYELDKSYAQITKETKVRPLALDAFRPSMGQDIQIISGYWDRGYECKIDGFVYKLKESDWTWLDSIRYSDEGCDTIGGTSGSPILAKGEMKVIGINNTGNESGEECTMNNPCEVNEQGTTYAERGVSYGQQTYKVYTCLSADFSFDLTSSTCELPH